MSNEEAILLFFYMPWFTQLISVLMFILCPSASLLRVLMSYFLKNSYSATTAVFRGRGVRYSSGLLLQILQVQAVVAASCTF